MALHAYYVHCASYNLDLLLNDAIKAGLIPVNFTTPLSQYIIFSDIVLCDGKSFRMSMICLAQTLH